MFAKIALIAFLLLLANIAAFACRCYSLAPGAAYAGNSDVMIVKVDSFTKGIGDTALLNGFYGANVIVEKAYKGTAVPGSKLFFRQSNGIDCLLEFRQTDLGKRFLIYATEPPDGVAGIWTATTCSRSREITRADDDLLFLDNLQNKLGTTRVSGTLTYTFDYELENGATKKIAGHTVVLTGNGIQRETRTNAGGVYEFLGLPPGVYRVKVDPYPPAVVVSRSGMGDVEAWLDASEKEKKLINAQRNLEERTDESDRDLSSTRVAVYSHGSWVFNFHFEPRSEVSGRVVTPSGQPPVSVDISLIPVNDSERATKQYRTSTDNGTYQITGIRPGKYYVVANRNNEISADQPFFTTYYPGVSSLDSATTIALAGGERLGNIDLRLGGEAPTTFLRGKVTFADGQPVFATIRFRPSGPLPGLVADSYTGIDKRGNFNMPVLAGISGELMAEISFDEQNARACRYGLRKITTQEEEIGVSVQLGPIRVTTDNSTRRTVFKLPFKKCGVWEYR